jgi:hypothetical protein
MLIAAAAATAVAVLITFAATATGAPARTRPFQITSVSPQNYKIVFDGAASTFTIRWSGTTKFPVTAYIIPSETCSSAGFTCGGFSHKFRHRASKLVWRDATSCYGGTLSAAYVGHEYLYLVNAKGRYTDALPLTFTCEP